MNLLLYLQPVKYIFLIILTFYTLIISAQKNIWENKNLNPEERLKGLEEWIWADYMQNSPDEAYKLAEVYLEFAKELNIDKYIATGLHLKGVSQYFKGEYNDALKFYSESLEIRKRIGDELGISSSLNNIAVVYKITGRIKEAVTIYLECAQISDKIHDKEGVAIAYGNLGVCYQNMGNMDQALEYSIMAQEEFKKLKMPEKLPNILRTIGTIYIERGEHARGIPYLEESLKIAERANDLLSVASAHEVLGMMYGQLLQSDKAMIHLSEAAKIYENAKYYSGLIINYNNVAGIYLQNKNYEQAELYYRKTQNLLKTLDEPISEAACLNGIAHIKLAQEQIDSAKHYLNKSMEIRLNINDPYGLANNYLMQIDLLLAENNLVAAIDAGNKAMEYAKLSKYLLAQRDISERMYKIFKIQNEPFKALEMHELYYLLRDSIDKTENQKEIIRREYSYQYEKQTLGDSLRRQEEKKIDDERHRNEIQEEETRRNALFVILGLVLLFALFIFNRFRVIKKQRDVIKIKEEETSKQKTLLAHQKETLEEKQKEIFDSINYARRLQDAILPPESLVKKLLPNGFILYKPKDIVAGDFYWIETLNDRIYLAAADCTGHGVPGAMVSVVCSNALTKALHEDEIKEPGKILDRTRELVIEQFARSEQEVKDGMDISLCSLTSSPPSEGLGEVVKLQWAGANNPIWIIRKGEVLETKPDKQPVGNYADAKPFTTHEISLQTGDSFYIFTDGFQDQFGGEKGKKYKASNLKEFIQSIVHHQADEQKELLNAEFEKWRKNTEQIDDVCIIGVRL